MYILIENLAFYEIMWKNIVKSDRPQMTIWRMRFASWKPKATNTNSEYVIFIAFSLRWWFHERPSVLRYTYVASIVFQLFLSWSHTPSPLHSSHEV